MYSDLFQKEAKISAELKLFLFICVQNDTYYLEDVPVFLFAGRVGPRGHHRDYFRLFLVWMKPGVSIKKECIHLKKKAYPSEKKGISI